MNKKKIITICASVVILAVAFVVGYILNDKNYNNDTKEENTKLSVNLSALSYEDNTKLKTYTQDDFTTFLNDYNANNLPKVYVTEFLFDGVGMYKPYDLDDFLEEGNDVTVKTLNAKVININTTGDITLSGDITGGMLAVNTNNVTGNINILLNGIKLDTDSKKIPAIYVYNKDRTYTGSKVTIKALKDTENYLEGGKLKKVSLVGSDELSNYTNKYSSTNQENYTKYTNYYGVYTSSDIKNILFATITADNEDLQDGDPYYFYKASGAISSDIDLYFEGEGYLEVTSKNKEGIETKGSLTFAGGTGDYKINAEDDCLNTTTDSKELSGAHNTLTIDVNSMYAIVSNDADEGDAIDSNGELIINGGTIVALAKPGQDAGIDSENGIYINGGTVLATGDMYDEVKDTSKQRFMVFNFNNKPASSDLITLLDSSDNVIFAYKTDRTYTSLVYSSSSLEEKTYYLYKNGTITGTEENGFYTKVNSYAKGTQLAYSSTGTSNGMIGGGDHGGGAMQGTRPERPNNDNNMTPPEKPNGDNNMTPPDGNMPNNGGTMPEFGNMPFEGTNNNLTATNKDFTISGIANLFSGVSNYSE